MKNNGFDINIFKQKLVDERDFLERYSGMPFQNFRNQTFYHGFLEGLEEFEMYIKDARIKLRFSELEVKLRELEQKIGILQVEEPTNQSYVSRIQEAIVFISQLLVIAEEGDYN